MPHGDDGLCSLPARKRCQVLPALGVVRPDTDRTGSWLNGLNPGRWWWKLEEFLE
jgi:hypothetical protein